MPRSSFHPPFPPARGTSPLLPFHNKPSSPLRTKTSEYDLAELPSRAEDALPRAETAERTAPSASPRRASSRSSDSGPGASSSRRTPHEMDTPGAAFDGPPPPVFRSKLLSDNDDGAGFTALSNTRSVPPVPSANQVPRWKGSDPAAYNITPGRPSLYEPNNSWRSLQRRERAVQDELQHLLDTQAATLSSTIALDVDDTRSTAPTETSHSTLSVANTRSGHSTRQNVPEGLVVPIRQPQKKRMGLRGARKGLARSMGALVDLKAEQNASLALSLSVRERALADLRRLSTRREGIAGELRRLETDDGESLTQNLQNLTSEHGDLCTEITRLEERLANLRRRQRWLEDRMADVRSRREAGLSGYRGALKEADRRLQHLLTQPPVTPLGLDVAIAAAESGDTNAAAGGSPSPGGFEFLRLRPERRTVEMAVEWWENEIELLQRRMIAVNKEQEALEEGAGVWEDVLKIVFDFEDELLVQLKAGDVTCTRGETGPPTSKDALTLQLGKLQNVERRLEQHLGTAEDRGWKLLICAIGAELAAFQMAQGMVRDMIGTADLRVEDIDPAPAHSSDEVYNEVVDSGENNRARSSRPHAIGVSESDNEVPPDLLVGLSEENNGGDKNQETAMLCGMNPEDSANDVPPEFLAEHRHENM